MRRLDRLPRGTGVLLAAGYLMAVGAYGLVIGERGALLRDAYGSAGDLIANAAGFRIETVTIKGQHKLSDAEIVAAAGITDTSSLPFLDIDAAREGLEKLPLVASATVHKLYPDTLAVAVVERTPYARWQKDGVTHIIAEDGTPLGAVQDDRFARLPLVVGEGANRAARALQADLAKAPAIGERVGAAIRVADRRWNLVLDNGVIVRLPEEDAVAALERLAMLESSDKVLGAAILAVDLRVPGRATFRLTTEAAAARAEELKSKKKGAA